VRCAHTAALAQENFSYNATSDIEWRDLASAGQLHQAAQPFAQTYQHGTATTRGHLHYRHDACGRMVERTILRNGFRPQTTYFKWDGFDRLVQAHCADGAIWRYSYDAFGRRTGKRCIQPARGSAHHAPSQQLQQESYLWDGATLAQQSKRYADGREEHLSWHYAPGSFTPLAVSHQTGDGTSRLLYVVADQLGTPRELVNAAGQVVWAAQLQTWGKLNHLWQQSAANDDETLPQLELRFPNQWHDAETGLHYNYQRYYEPELGQYCSPDPIGVAGGLRQQGYVHDPAGWSDPLGLAGCGGGAAVGRHGALNQAKRDLGIPRAQHPAAINRVPLTNRNGNPILGGNGKRIMTREYLYKRADGSEIIIQDHSAGHQFGEGGIGDQGPHFNVRPVDNPRTGHVPGTSEHYSF
jgi:RHS repeat-associated protein